MLWLFGSRLAWDCNMGLFKEMTAFFTEMQLGMNLDVSDHCIFRIGFWYFEQNGAINLCCFAVAPREGRVG